MHVKKTQLSPTKVQLTITGIETDLQPIKHHTLQHFAKEIKVPGFREGKAPLAMVEKHVDSNRFQSEFFDEALQELYVQAATQERIRPAGAPQVILKKFVPYTELEFEVTVEVFGEVKLADYKKVNVKKADVSVSADDVKEVLDSLQKRAADKKAVDRKAKEGDELIIDFAGVDAAGKAIAGAEGKAYPLLLGSSTFIPGFESNLVGLKAGEDKTFDLTFPKTYGVKALANKKVTFTVTVQKVQEVIDPKLDDAFAAKVGPFKTLAELKADIKKQLQAERANEAERDYESALVKAIAAKSKLEVPEALVNEQVDFMVKEFKQNLLYRGQTYEEFLETEGKTDEAYRAEVLTPDAAERVKAGLVLAEIAEQENIQVSKEELDIRMQVLKGQYQDAKMQAELDKPEARRDIASRMMSEKTVAKIKQYNA
jgi:trigger factor